ncbi:MAG: glycosyltransferase [Desulfohalobiaceae bacterium]
MDEPTLCADLHVHSRHSTRPSQWILQKLGCPESFTEPSAIYSLARARGMDLVTITDHNTLAGSLEIANLPGTFLSEEITTYFPEDRCKLHVLALGITEEQHRDISKLRANVFELVPFLRAANIVHVLAHPLFAINDRLTMEHFEQTLLLFKHFECNGTRDDFQNQTLAAILDSLRREDIERLADKHGIAPDFDRPWEKVLTGGSDDHSSLNVARVFTRVAGVRTAKEFLSGLAAGSTTVQGRAATPRSMGHNLYSIAYQFCKSKFRLERFSGKDHGLRFADAILTPNGQVPGVFCRLQGMLYRSPAIFKARPRSLQDIMMQEARAIVDTTPHLQAYIRGKRAEPWIMEEDWFSFVDRASERVVSHCADTILDSFSGARLFDIFQTMGSAGSLYTLLAPYFVAYKLFTKDRRFTKQSRRTFCGQDGTGEPDRLTIGHFTDTFHEFNGVARTLQMQVAIAGQSNKRYNVITCGPGARINGVDGVVTFEPTGCFELPYCPDMKLFYPPVLRMLDYCFDRGFTHIHSATPGPMGLAALVIARILQIPIHGSYHAAFPQYAGELTGDVSLEEAAWKYMTWYYNQMDSVNVPSRACARELQGHGIDHGRIRVCPQGIDTVKFHPSRRNGYLNKRYNVPAGSTTLLYVGRVSRELHLPVLLQAFKNLSRQDGSLHLVVTGEGPYLGEMEQELSGFPATFTGRIQGEELAMAYASSDIFVFPAANETFGTPVLEAQASGLPAVVSSSGVGHEHIIPGETGLVFAANDPRSLEQTLARLINDAPLLKAMRTNAPKHMENRSFEAAFLKTWDDYRSCELSSGMKVAV